MKLLTLNTLILVVLFSILLYVGSIFWRVSVAEDALFGRSDLLKITSNPPKYRKTKHPPPEAFGSGTFVYDRYGRPVVVWHQKINGFQHLYGSALAAFELGEKPADGLFCLNEHVEAFFDLLVDPYGITAEDLWDRRKDLFHNRVGRGVGVEARKQKLWGPTADRYIQKRLLAIMDEGAGFIPHYASPRVNALPDEAAQGCPYLPGKLAIRQWLF